MAVAFSGILARDSRTSNAHGNHPLTPQTKSVHSHTLEKKNGMATDSKNVPKTRRSSAVNAIAKRRFCGPSATVHVKKKGRRKRPPTTKNKTKNKRETTAGQRRLEPMRSPAGGDTGAYVIGDDKWTPDKGQQLRRARLDPLGRAIHQRRPCSFLFRVVFSRFVVLLFFFFLLVLLFGFFFFVSIFSSFPDLSPWRRSVPLGSALLKIKPSKTQ